MGCASTPDVMTVIFPSGGMWVSRMLHPTQPARRAVAARGGRCSIALSVKKNLGIRIRFCTSQVEEYCRSKGFGV